MTSTRVSTMESPGIKISSLVVALMIIASTMHASALELREGDLLFACSDTANAITAVTSGVGHLPIDHVGIVHRIGGNEGPVFVIEAIQPQVCLTPIDTFLNVGGHVIAGRLKVAFDVQQSIRRCLHMVGKPYDDLYLPGDSAVYCSELVQMNYVDMAGKRIFEPVPMSFHDDSGRITDYWQEFYMQRGMVVPEGMPGSNPGELSRRSEVIILGKYPFVP